MKPRPSSITILLSTMLLAATAIAGEATQKRILTIVFTGESHAALLPCDCPLQPLGGVARRATIIKQLKARGPVLVVDAGGWGAGGIYDEDSDGDQHRDSLRSRLMATAMVAMGYDLISATPKESMSLVSGAGASAKTVQHAIGSPEEPIAVTVEQRAPEVDQMLFSASKALPLGGARMIAPRVILSRLGEEESSALAAELKDEALIINAGRKVSQRISWRVGNSVVANFDYQAKSLGVAEVFEADPATSAGRKFDIRVRQQPLGAEVPDDPQIAEMLKPHLAALKKKTKSRVEIEFWTMPECPGCAQARPDIHRIAEDLRERARIVVRFVTHKEDGKLASLHGPRELQEAHVQAVIQKYYPEKLWDWMDWREKNIDTPWQDGAKQFGMLVARINGAISSGQSTKLLETDYELMQRRQVTSSPTLVIGNQIFEDQLERLRVLRVLCGMLDAPKPSACKDVPECFFDAQCRKRGYVGRCVDAGKPTSRCDTSRPAVKVPAIIINDRDNFFDNRERIISALTGDLPGIEFKFLDITDPEARDLVEKLKIARLPAYIIDPIAKTEVDYAENIGKVAAEDTALKKLVIRSFAVGAHRLLNRQRIRGRADLFVSRLSKNGQEALETALETLNSTQTRPELAIHDALYWKEDVQGKRELAASNGIAEIQEAAIAMAVRKIAPEKLNAYFLERGKQRGALYWDIPLKAVGIDAVKVRELAEKPSEEIVQALQVEAELLKSIESGGDITLLAENCELIPIRSRKDLRDILERIGQRKK